VKERSNNANLILGRLNISNDQIVGELNKRVSRGSDTIGQDMNLSLTARSTINLAHDEARRLSDSYIGTEHLLLSLVSGPDNLTGEVFSALGLIAEDVREEARIFLNLLLKAILSSTPPIQLRHLIRLVG
jgi:ATP-dependent Clp protease ATP-binding subunit ClpC